jgi:hypothetical protein
MTDQSERIEGRCLCGAVTVRINPTGKHVEACHCGMCQRWGGSALLSLKGVTEAEFDGEENVGSYRSSEWAERGFCTRCGSSLYYLYLPKGSYAFAAGLFDNLQGYRLGEEIFIDDKPDYYDFAGERERLTGAEVMAKFGVGQS